MAAATRRRIAALKLARTSPYGLRTIATPGLVAAVPDERANHRPNICSLEDMPSREEVIDALRAVEDPELGMDIVELGLLYDVEVEGPKVHMTYSLTSMGCPVGPMIEQQMLEVVEGLEGVDDVKAELTWEPPWSPEKMSDDAKFILGFGY